MLNEQLKLLSDSTNRSLHQTKFLYELCDCDFDKLQLYENIVKQKYCGILVCPADKEELEQLLKG